MKRILHVIDTTGPGGAETIFVELADRMRQRGFESLTLLRGPGWVYDTLRQRGLEPFILDAKGSFNWRYLRDLAGLIRNERVDLVQSHLLGSNIYCAAAGGLARRPVVATFHGAVDVNPNERFRRIKFGLMNKTVSHFVTVSDSLKHAMQAAGLTADEHTSALYNGVDLSRYDIPRHRRLTEELGLPRDALLIGSLGNIRPAKAYDVLIQAAGQVIQARPEAHFLVAGHINESVFRPLKTLMAELSLEDRIHFLGFRPDTAEFLRGLDAFALSSSSEGFSIATVEALAAGLPVVATRCGGPEEILEHGRTGLLVPANDPEALAEAISRVLSDKPLAESLSAAGRAKARSRFSIEAMLGGYETIYRGLLR